MAGRTISAYTDDVTAQRVATLARMEDRSTGQIAAAALRLYTNLPTEARQALRQIEAMESPEVLEDFHRAMTRLLLNAVYDSAHRRLMSQMPAAEYDSEDAILAEANRLASTH
jgi:hypothetical protein